MKPAGLFPDRHPLDLPHRPHGVEVTKDQDPAGTAGELSPEVIAATPLREPRDAGAGIFEPGNEEVTAAIDGGFVVAGVTVMAFLAIIFGFSIRGSGIDKHPSDGRGEAAGAGGPSEASGQGRSTGDTSKDQGVGDTFSGHGTG